MKMNKLAAGALALALGLGAVAPAVAAETKSYTGAQLVLEKYERELKEANKLRERALIADERIAAAEAKTDAAKKAYNAARKAYDELFPGQVTDGKGGVLTVEELAARPVTDAIKELEAQQKDGSVQIKFENGDFADADLKNAYKAEMDGDVVKKTAEEKLAEELEKKITDARDAELVKVFAKRVAKAYAQYKSDVKDGSEKQLALLNLRAATEAKQAAELNEKRVKNAEEKHVKAYDAAIKELGEKAKGYGWVVQVGNNGVQLVKPEDAKVKAPGQKQSNVAELKRAKADAETAIKAVKLLKELSPEKIKKVEAKLNEKVMKAQELIKKADAKIAELEKKTAFIATAYADEADDTDALIKELDSTTGEIKDLIKDTPEDKKANEEKKPEEKKPEDKKEEKTPSKKAGNNAKTGIAGIAGVAGILAAASVAYAASKRD